MAGIRDFKDRVVVVTGGASGIGRGIAEEFLSRGAHVVIADIDDAVLQSTATELGATGIRTDVTDASSVEQLASQIDDLFGRVDIVCNNAGVGPKANVENLTLADWRWILDVNLFGVIHGVHSFLPRLKANTEGGWIVNTASMSTFFTPPSYAPYVASKAAVTGLSEVLARELAEAGARIGVTVLHPGAVRTNIKESMRTRPSDVSEKSGLYDFDIAQKLPDTARWATPRQTGHIVVRAVENGDAYAFTHPEMLVDAHVRFRAVEDALTRYPILE